MQMLVNCLQIWNTFGCRTVFILERSARAYNFCNDSRCWSKAEQCFHAIRDRDRLISSLKYDSSCVGTCREIWEAG